MMPLASLFRRNRYRPQAFAAYASIVEHARAPDFFLRLDVPDTLDGRFEMIALHMFLVLNRLIYSTSIGRMRRVIKRSAFCSSVRMTAANPWVASLRPACMIWLK